MPGTTLHYISTRYVDGAMARPPWYKQPKTFQA